MRKGVSLLCLAASDVACIIAGFIAGVLAIQLLATVGHPDAASSVFQSTRPGLADTRVNRAGKSDRSDLVSFGDRFGATFGTPRETTAAPRDDQSGRALFGVDPAGGSTIVPKGVIPSDTSSRPSNGSAQESRGARKPPPSPLKAVGCEPVASPLVDPGLARFTGRCFTQLAFPPGAAL